MRIVWIRIYSLDINDKYSTVQQYPAGKCATCNIYTINPEFSLRDYNDKIVKHGMDPEDVFLKPVDRIHFFTNKLISQGL